MIARDSLKMLDQHGLIWQLPDGRFAVPVPQIGLASDAVVGLPAPSVYGGEYSGILAADGTLKTAPGLPGVDPSQQLPDNLYSMAQNSALFDNGDGSYTHVDFTQGPFEVVALELWGTDFASGARVKAPDGYPMILGYARKVDRLDKAIGGIGVNGADVSNYVFIVNSSSEMTINRTVPASGGSFLSSVHDFISEGRVPLTVAAIVATAGAAGAFAPAVLTEAATTTAIAESAGAAAAEYGAEATAAETAAAFGETSLAASSIAETSAIAAAATEAPIAETALVASTPAALPTAAGATLSAGSIASSITAARSLLAPSQPAAPAHAPAVDTGAAAPQTGTLLALGAAALLAKLFFFS
jgi:hypothetical protein